MNSIQKIQNLLQGIDREKRNNTDIDKVYINIVKNEFIIINERINIPKIPVKELEYKIAVPILKNLIEYIPEFLINHELLVDRKPASDQHCLHFIKKVKGRLINFIHIFKIYLKFEGDSQNIIERGDTDSYPSYHTDRIYYKSKLIPVSSVFEDNRKMDFEPIKLIESDYLESDQRLFTSAIFDEVNKKELTEDIINKLDLDVFNISIDLYPFIEYDYFTSCFNVLCPSIKEIEEGAMIFEPSFLTLYSRYNDLTNLNDLTEIGDKFEDSISFDDKIPILKEEYVIKLKEYFERFSIYRDDDLSLKGWWRIDF